MKKDQLNHQVALTFLEGVGVKNAKTLIAYLGGVEKLFDPSFDFRTKVPGFKKERFRNLNRKEALEKAIPILEFIEKYKVDTTFFTDRRYPKRLKNCADGPTLLYHKGNFDFNHKRTLAIVGTRKMTHYGMQIINELIETLAPYNVQVISGLAMGVDGYAHKKCLELGVPTIGVLGHGLDRVYPASHRQLAQKMLRTEGCGLLTEFPNDTLPDRENFPQRNRIVAGMADATIVIESGESGGSLITANLANDYDRDVFAYPGDINKPYSKGCNFLIANDKAHLVTSGKDIVKLLGWEIEDGSTATMQMNLFEDLEGDEKSIVEEIKEFDKISLDVLSLRLRKPVHVLSSLLLGLELRGIVMSLPGKNYALGR